ncbi:baseplate J/gp47 family protein [Streptomyces sp. NPDC059918]|uniref:baseplate J/gp47 family protein n=1 Tax=unclassified Streptomyces TaxID=2593676 RepID=UPI00364B9FDE
MAYGVTPDGFVLKGLDVILAESKARTRAALGADVDLSPTSPLGKILEVVAQEDAELWKRMEALYYGQFTATADGAALELLGDDAGLARNAPRRAGAVVLTLTGGVPGRTYVLPEATVLLGDGDGAGGGTGGGEGSGAGGDSPRAFATTAPVELTAAAPTRTVRVLAVEPGDAPVAAATVDEVHPAHRAQYLADWPPAALVVTNPAPFDELIPEDDDAYRARIIALPRALWTVESVRQAALSVPDVLDARVTDPLGGIDVSQAYFGGFDFGGRTFSDERRVGEPYFADVAVAHRGLRPWRTLPGPGSVTGVYELVAAAVDRVRPIGVHVNVVEADHIDVGVRAGIVLAAGFDGPTVIGRIRARLAADIGRLRLGDDVLYARVMCTLAEQPGVDDVRGLHLRRCPPAFGRFGFGGVPYQLGTVEAAVGESLAMSPTEMAVFAADPALSSIEVAGR